MDAAVYNDCKENDAAVSINNKSEGDLISEKKFDSKSNTPILQKQEGGKENHDVNGFAENDISDSFLQKPVSPTLIEHALKVMKNLFSPDKNKNQPVKTSTPVGHQLSESESPRNSVCTPKTGENCFSESGIEEQNNRQSVDNNEFEDHQSLVNQLGVVPSPLNIDFHTSKNDSFYTSVSVLDESFHSTVTQLDENGKNMEGNLLNNTSDSNLVGSLNDTLEDIEYCLENTVIIQNGANKPEKEIKILKSSENILINNGSGLKPKDLEKIRSDEISNDELLNKDLKENNLHVIEKKINKIRIMPENNIENHNQSGGDNEFIMKPCEKLSKECFEDKQSANQKLQNNVNINKEQDEEVAENKLKIILEMKNIGNKINSEDRDSLSSNSVSTTTIVLSETDSAVDLENVLASLKADDSGTNTSSLTSFESSEDIGSVCSENLGNKNFEIISNSKIYFSDLCLDKNTPVEKKEGESKNIPSNKLIRNTEVNDGFVCVSNQNSNELSEEKNTVEEMIELGVVSNNAEIKSEDSKQELGLQFTVNENSTNPASQNVRFEGRGIEEDINKNSFIRAVNPDVTDFPSVVSQKSYTVLNVDNKNLSRPVINSSEKLSNDFPDDCLLQQTTHTDAKDKTDLVATESSDKVCGNIVLSSVETSNQVDTAIEKNITEVNLMNETIQVSKSILEKPDSSEIKNNIEEDTGVSKCNFGVEKTHLENSFEAPPNVNSTFFKDADKNLKIDVSSSPKQRKQFKSPGSNKSSRAMGKKLKTPKSKKLNQTFDVKGNTTVDTKPQLVLSPNQILEKKEELVVFPRFDNKLNKISENKSDTPASNKESYLSNEVNQSFDKKLPSSYYFDETATEETETVAEAPLNLSFNKQSESPVPNAFNQTFDKKTNIPEKNSLNLTFNKQVEGSAMNSSHQSFDKSDSSPLNLTFEKKINSLTSNHANENYEKKPEFTGAKNSTYEESEILKGQKKPEKTAEIFGEDDAVKQTMNSTYIDEKNAKIPDLIPSDTIKVPKVSSIPDVFNKLNKENVENCQFNNFENFRESLNESVHSTASSNFSSLGDENATALFNLDHLSKNLEGDDLALKMNNMNLNGDLKSKDQVQDKSEEKEKTVIKSPNVDDKSMCDVDLVQLIREQFSSNDIEKICCVVDDMTSMKLTTQILKASQQFEKSFCESISNNEKTSSAEEKFEKAGTGLTPQSFDFLSSIGGKPTGRDLARESLYVKFDPLVQPSNTNSLIDFTKEVESVTTVESSKTDSTVGVCEQLLSISPEKKSDDIVPPLTPLSNRNKANKAEEKLKELQNEIYFLKNLYAEREKINKSKIDDFETKIAKATGEICLLEDKLKESSEREKSLVKKLKEQTQSNNQLKIVMDEYGKVISKLTAELENLRSENAKQVEALLSEKDSYITHLQNTEAAFTDVHTKYEKSKKTIVNLKTNEAMYKKTIAEQAQKLEDFKERAREAQEKAWKEFQKVHLELEEEKNNHGQEVVRIRAMLRKTELKLEALQESYNQKVKENEQLTAICDEFIEGKK